MAVVDPSEARMEVSHRWTRNKVSALAALLLLAQLTPAVGQGRKEPEDPPDQPSAPKQGCAILPAAKVEAVFGHFDDAVQNGGYQNEAKLRTGRIAEHTSATCLFRRNASPEGPPVITHWYPSYDDASAAFAGAIKASSHGVPFFTKGARQGPVQMFEGKGRAVGYVNNSVAIVHWTIVKGTVPEPADVPGEKLVPIIIASICSRYPDCGKASNPVP